MNAWLDMPETAAITRSFGFQEVMVGYSDSNKDGGYLTSVWSLHQATRTLAAVFEKYATPMQVFHGRGGAVGRGGGSSFAAIRAQPHGTVRGRIRITEQGEIIAAKYGTRESAATNLESIAAATVLASLENASLSEGSARRFAAAMDDLSKEAFRAYRALVYETEGFRDIFQTIDAAAGDLRTENWFASGLAYQLAAYRGPARNSVGIQLGAGPGDVAGMVWRGSGNAIGRCGIAAGNARCMAVLSRHGR